MLINKSILRIFPILFNIVIVLALLVGSVAFPTGAHAFGATITVTSILDNTAPGAGCTLREAIANANNNAATYADCVAGLSGTGDVIVFSSGLGSATITLGSTLPAISDTTGLTINGGDAITISGNNLYRVLIVNGSVPLTLDSLTVSNGKVVGSGVGGGIFNAAGMLTLTNCLLSGNSTADGNGGGIYSTGGALTITDSIFSNNSATKVSSGGYGGGVYTFSPTTITRTIFSGNSANIRGGGIYSYFGTMTITDSMFTNNSMSSAGDGGGGIYSDNSTLTITHSSFSNNHANSAGSNGGGINNDQGTLTITNSTFSGNSVTTGVGGGIVTGGADGTVTIANSTFFSNYADFGGGIYNGIGGTLTVTNGTFSGNSTLFTTVFGGGIYNEATLNLYNTILANSINGGDCYNSLAFGTTTGSNSLIEDASSNACGLTNGVNGNIIGSDPNLGPATLLSPIYFPLNAGSPAIDAGDDAKCADALVNNTSQNGLTRPQGAHCDIGSYEFPDLTLPSVTSSVLADPNPTVASSVNFTVTFSEPVTGVDTVAPFNDFSLTTTGGVSGAAVSGISGSANAYTVTVNTGNGNGTIRLDVPVSATINDLAGNPLTSLPYIIGTEYTVIKVHNLFLPLILR